VGALSSVSLSRGVVQKPIAEVEGLQLERFQHLPPFGEEPEVAKSRATAEHERPKAKDNKIELEVARSFRCVPLGGFLGAQARLKAEEARRKANGDAAAGGEEEVDEEGKLQEERRKLRGEVDISEAKAADPKQEGAAGNAAVQPEQPKAEEELAPDANEAKDSKQEGVPSLMPQEKVTHSPTGSFRRMRKRQREQVEQAVWRPLKGFI
jgi:hypothetical protein